MILGTTSTSSYGLYADLDIKAHALRELVYAVDTAASVSLVGQHTAERTSPDLRKVVVGRLVRESKDVRVRRQSRFDRPCKGPTTTSDLSMELNGTRCDYSPHRRHACPPLDRKSDPLRRAVDVQRPFRLRAT